MDQLNLVAGVMWLGFFGITAIKFAQCIRLVPTRKAYIVERLGKYHRTLGPGLQFLVPFFDRVAYIQDLKEESIEVPPQECFTSDNVRVEVDGVIYISVVNPENASYGITDYRYAAVQLAQTTTRSVIGTLELDRTFEEREAINSRVVGVLSEVGDAWGIRVHRYEVKNIVPPASVRDAMERQMGAERERRALLARSEGDKQSRVNFAEGQRAEAINRSEGEKQRRINEAEGRARELISIAQATAESIRKMGQVMSLPGGADAIRHQLSQKYLSQLSSLAQPNKHIVLPADLTRMDELLAAVGLDAESFAVEPAGAPPRGGSRALPAPEGGHTVPVAAPASTPVSVPVAQASAVPAARVSTTPQTPSAGVSPNAARGMPVAAPAPRPMAAPAPAPSAGAVPVPRPVPPQGVPAPRAPGTGEP